ncbi:hypothetical protein HYQ45_016751 [Verticillium longisporum]|uniref:Uncharacterized protein n=1 Tax=Verticillium longisporum TaxID=100787 RepID=A0A8I3AGB6_VERLO|nr:hypothetical protein HYQ45_016751 [Verticillium longisporum]
MDNYSDDGFDDLNPNVLQELENNAIQFTQAQTQAPPRTQQPADNPYNDLEFEDDDLDDTELIDGLLPQAPVARPAYQQPLASQAPRESGNDVVAAMQQRLKALESELYSAKGEVAIIRANSSKAQQEYTTEVARLKKQNAEQEAKQQRLVEQAVAAQNNATTELQFLQRDVKETSARARRANAAPGVQRNDSGGSATNTPKKTSKTWGMADGFDEMDIVLSPSKGRGKSRDTGPVAIPLTERTPTKNKRKRPVVDSPVPRPQNS